MVVKNTPKPSPGNGQAKVFYDRMYRELGVTEAEVKVLLTAKFEKWQEGMIEEYQKVIEEYVEQKRLGRIQELRGKIAYIPTKCPVCGKPTQKGTADFFKCEGKIKHAVLWRTSSIALAEQILTLRKQWCSNQLMKSEECNET